MKILNLVFDEEESYFAGFYENNGEFGRFNMRDGVIDLQPDGREFESYKQFSAIYGKFNPYIRFTASPSEIEELTIDELRRIKHRFNQDVYSW